jgi:DNA repair protein RecN (Recombination protein N)
LEESRRVLEESARDAEFLRHSMDELDKLSPEVGEADALDAERRLMQAAERIREDVARAAQALGLEGAEGAMSDAARWLDGVTDRAEGRLDEALGALERARNELGEAQRGVEEALEALSDDPARLEMVEERLFALRGLARKHRVQPDELPAMAEDFARRLAAIDGGEAEIAGLEAAVAKAEAEYARAAAALSARRADAAVRLDKEVAAELAPLKLERAVFSTTIEAREPGPDGVDHVEFRIATNPGAKPGPIASIASGGELSRFLLAIKVRLAGRADGVSMIFDEIDRGVGGATADAVGRRLSRLSEEAQVLVVTHSPQVAARARHHWRIAKLVGDKLAVTDVVRLAEGERAEEIARMLAGETVTEAAREAARTLLAG